MEKEITEEKRLFCLGVIAKWLKQNVATTNSDEIFMKAMLEHSPLVKSTTLEIRKGESYDQSTTIFQSIFKRARLSFKNFPEIIFKVNLCSNDLVTVNVVEGIRPIVLCTEKQFQETHSVAEAVM